MEETFKITLEDGTNQQCKVLFTYDTDELSYVLYTVLDENGNESEEVSALRYELDENGHMTNFTPLETEEEWDMADEVLSTLAAEFGDAVGEYFTVVDENGEEAICEIIHQFDLEQFGKSYILYTFADQDEVGEIFAASFIEGEDGGINELLPIETDEEWAAIEQEIQNLETQQ
ncbi:DUF1292 domain-containing protein [Ureibacillus sp. NPDC094379]